MTDFNDDDYDRDFVPSQRRVHKERSVEYRREPKPAQARVEPKPQPQPTAKAQDKAETLPRRRRPPPGPEAPVPRNPLPPKPVSPAGGGAAGGGEQVQREAPFEQTDADARIGYGNPPQHSRFVKGKSGNPKGRPKGSKSFRTYIREELGVTVPVNDQGRRRKMPRRQVMAIKAVQDAMKGDPKKLALVMSYDVVDDDLPTKPEPLTEIEREMMAHYFGVSDDEGEEE